MAALRRWTEFAARLKSARYSAGLTAEECACKFRVDPTTYRVWERGVAKPRDPERIYEISAALNVQPAWLARGSGPRSLSVPKAGIQPQPCAAIASTQDGKPSELYRMERLILRARRLSARGIRLFVAYRRVSYQVQADEGFGLEGQLLSIQRYVRGKGKIVTVFTEVQSGRLTADRRAALKDALELCKLLRAILVVAKLDRLARNVAFVAKLLASKVEIVAVDMPQANRFTLHVMAALAEYEIEMMSIRLREASAVRKSLGKRSFIKNIPERASEIGRIKSAKIIRQRVHEFILRLSPIIRALHASGITRWGHMATILNQSGVPTYRSGQWRSRNVANLAARMRPPIFSAHGASVVAQRRAKSLLPVISEIIRSGAATVGQIGARMEERGIYTANGKSWDAAGLVGFIQLSGVTLQELRESVSRERSANANQRQETPSLPSERKNTTIGIRAARIQMNEGMKPQISARCFVTYLRVSTDEQAQHGFSLEAQRRAVNAFTRKKGPIIREFVEAESAYMTNRRRPELAAAIALCRESKAALVVSRLDRLARNLAFVTQLMQSGIEFIAADTPTASRLTVQILAAFAEYESRIRSERIRAGKAVARALGESAPGGFGSWPVKKWRRFRKELSVRAQQRSDDFARKVHPIIDGLRAEGFVTYKAIAAALTARNVPAFRSKMWSVSAVIAFDRRCRTSVLSRQPLKTLHCLALDRYYAKRIRKIQSGGTQSYSEIVKKLKASDLERPRGGKWNETIVSRTLAKAGATEVIGRAKHNKCIYIIPPL